MAKIKAFISLIFLIVACFSPTIASNLEKQADCVVQSKKAAVEPAKELTPSIETLIQTNS